jgi:hypothetical protein
MTLLVLVDVTNVARSSSARARWPKLADEERNRRCADAVASWAAQRGFELVAAIDGGAASADQQLVDAAQLARKDGRRWWIASDDRELCEIAGVGAERVLDSAGLIAALDVAPDIEPPLPEPDAQSSVGDRQSEDVRQRLERLRRGES